MRTLMMLASIILLAAGTFCMANSAVPFISVAFIVGAAVLFLGICELIVIRRTIMDSYEPSSEVNAEGIIAVILGIVFLSGMVSEGIAVTSLFALWTTTEGVKSISNANYDVRSNSSIDNLLLGIGIITTLFGVYMFFNIKLLNLPVLLMVGISLFLISINRFKIALAIEYKAPSFMSGNKEKLHEAKLERTRAMQKAKEGIRETKEAERKIERLSREVAREESMKSDMTARRSARKN